MASKQNTRIWICKLFAQQQYLDLMQPWFISSVVKQFMLNRVVPSVTDALGNVLLREHVILLHS